MKFNVSLGSGCLRLSLKDRVGAQFEDDLLLGSGGIYRECGHVSVGGHEHEKRFRGEREAHPLRLVRLKRYVVGCVVGHRFGGCFSGCHLADFAALEDNL